MQNHKKVYIFCENSVAFSLGICYNREEQKHGGKRGTDMEIQFTKNIPVRYTTDVLVVGGGPSGVAAAVLCARAQKNLGENHGKHVLLLEQSGTFGGSSTLAGVPELMNFDDGQHFLAKGFGEEIYTALYGDCPLGRNCRTVQPERLKRLYDRMMEESGAAFHFYSRVVDVIQKEGRITHVLVSAPEGLYAIQVQVVIDCTGNGAICAMAGCDYTYGDEEGNTMSATLCSTWGGVDFSRKTNEDAYIPQAYRDGVFSQYDTVLPGIKPTFPALGVGGGNVGHCFGVKDIDTESITTAMVEGRRRLEEYQYYYNHYVPGCENAVLMDSAPYLGIRESRRICCIETLTEKDFYDQRSKPNEIGRYSYPIDIHPVTADKTGMQDFGKHISCRHKDGESYSIPYGCLVPQNTRNLLVAGRCVGTDRAMQASIRVIPGCYIMGQAAGIAAALSVQEQVEPAQVNVEKLQLVLSDLCHLPS